MLIFLAVVVLMNAMIYRKNQAWPQAIVLSVLLAVIASAGFQIFVFFSQGYLDPFFIIAFVVQVTMASPLGLLTKYLLSKL